MKIDMNRHGKLSFVCQEINVQEFRLPSIFCDIAQSKGYYLLMDCTQGSSRDNFKRKANQNQALLKPCTNIIYTFSFHDPFSSESCFVAYKMSIQMLFRGFSSLG
jgi:hypothetical protein